MGSEMCIRDRVLDPATIDPKAYTKAASIGGMADYGRPTPLEEAPRPDLLVVGSVAVSPAGARTGKGSFAARQQ